MINIPLSGAFKVTNPFGVDGNYACGWHTGIDLVSNNTTIYSSCEGRIIRTGYDRSYGNFIVIQNSVDGLFHWFCHLSSIKRKSGNVTRETVIGIMRKYRKLTRQTFTL